MNSVVVDNDDDDDKRTHADTAHNAPLPPPWSVIYDRIRERSTQAHSDGVDRRRAAWRNGVVAVIVWCNVQNLPVNSTVHTHTLSD